ncbi:protein singles bar [Bacillus rossius redtenbacheri]|uniref:protein singles bar n=1 Tax=Bacillus rossius redtenbacheri TaxID=93214 RepID=UPI002FDECA01
MGSRYAGAPRIVTVSGGGGGSGGGVHCCCCTCCTCVHLQFLKTGPGVAKLVEVVLAGLCQSMLLNYGLRHSADIGPAYDSFLTAASSCFMTSGILLACYLLSENSYRLVRSSLFEVMFNAVASFLYLSAASYMGYTVNLFLWPKYLITPYYQVYPAMTAVYIFGYVLGAVHAYDAYVNYRHIRGHR